MMGEGIVALPASPSALGEEGSCFECPSLRAENCQLRVALRPAPTVSNKNTRLQQAKFSERSHRAASQSLPCGVCGCGTVRHRSEEAYFVGAPRLASLAGVVSQLAPTEHRRPKRV